MKTLNNNSGFTLIELILVIAILGIMAVAVVPRFVDIQASAQNAQRDGTVAAIKDGITMQYGLDLADDGQATFLTALDSQANGACATCFDAVLQEGLDSGWTKNGNVYTHTATTSEYTYDSGTGAFTCTANC